MGGGREQADDSRGGRRWPGFSSDGGTRSEPDDGCRDVESRAIAAGARPTRRCEKAFPGRWMRWLKVGPSSLEGVVVGGFQCGDRVSILFYFFPALGVLSLIFFFSGWRRGGSVTVRYNRQGQSKWENVCGDSRNFGDGCACGTDEGTCIATGVNAYARVCSMVDAAAEAGPFFFRMPVR